jgi:hypothetical protein
MKSKTPEYKREYWKKYRLKYKPYKIKLCVDCGKEYSQSSNAQKRCPDCMKIKCEHCGILFVPQNHTKNHRFCSKKCHTETMKGVEPIALQNKRGKKPRTYHLKKRDKHGGIKDIEWRNKIFERDNYTCTVCGKLGGKLQAHHIKPYKEHPHLRHRASNGTTLCIDCHKKTESYGWANYWKKKRYSLRQFTQEVMNFD